MDSKSLEQKMRFREKAAFSMANFGNIPVMAITGAFLLIFYTDVVGLDAAACATLFLVARLFDGITDPLLGYFIDHLPITKRGRFRTPLAVGSVLTALNLVLLFVGPYFATSFKLGIAYISYLLIGVVFDVMDISLNSLLPVMSGNMKDRSSLSAVKGMSYIIGILVINIVAPIVVGNTSEARGYITLVVGASIIVVLFSLIGSAGVKERIQPVNDEKYKLKDLLKIIAQRPVATQFACSLLTTTGAYVVQTVNMFFFAYIIGDIRLLGLASMGSMITLFPGMLLSGFLTPRFGKKKVFIFGLLLVGVAPLLRLLNVTNVPLLLGTTLLSGFGSGINQPLSYGMQADNTDYVELSLGHRTEAAVASLSSYITKFAMGIGGAIPGYLLAWGGYDSTLEVQSSTAKTAIIISVCVAPAVFNILGATVMTIFYPLTKEKLEEQIKEIEKIRAVS